jgi:hypothetical protein
MSGFEYPFSEALRPEHPLETKRKEGLKVVDLEFTTDADGVYYREKFNDGSVGNWRQTEVAANDPVRAENKKRELESEYGLLEEDKEMA